MTAICKCLNGHVFSSDVVADEPDTNYFEIADEECPECGELSFDVIDVDFHDDDWEF